MRPQQRAGFWGWVVLGPCMEHADERTLFANRLQPGAAPHRGRRPTKRRRLFYRDIQPNEVSVRALRLLQPCLVNINALMLQRVLAEPAWMARMTPADRRGNEPPPNRECGTK